MDLILSTHVLGWIVGQPRIAIKVPDFMPAYGSMVLIVMGLIVFDEHILVVMHDASINLGPLFPLYCKSPNWDAMALRLKTSIPFRKNIFSENPNTE